MTNISKSFAGVVGKELKKNPIIPVKVENGILVGDVSIITNGSVKDIFRNDELLYSNVHLNVAAIAIANKLALRHPIHVIDKIYTADREYGRWFDETQMLIMQHKRFEKVGNYHLADVLWAKLEISKERAKQAKANTEALAVI